MFRFYRKEVYFSTKQSFAFWTKEHNLLKIQAMKITYRLSQAMKNTGNIVYK